MSEIDTYRQWLASGNEKRVVIETLQISHPKWGDEYFANWDIDLQGSADGKIINYNKSRFYLDPATVSDGTEQATQVVVSSLGGVLYKYLKDMTAEERQTEIKVTHRLYFHDDMNTVLREPAPVWTLHAIEANREAIKGSLRAAPLRVKRIGRYYTKREFPVLVYV